jgi:tRNA(fMet)-specific endonuclease VapC
LARRADRVSLLPVLEMPSKAADQYGEMRAGLEARGEAFGGHDLWIAAHDKALGLILVADNEREFQRAGAQGAELDRRVTRAARR